MQNKEKDSENNIQQFKQIRKKIFKATLASVFLTFIAVAIVGLQVLYPFHVVIGIGIYVLSFIPLFRRIYLSRRSWKKYKSYNFAIDFFKKEKKRGVFGVIFIIVVMSFLVLRPIGSDIFKDISEDEIRQVVVDDIYQAVTAIDYLETSGNKLIESLEIEDENAISTEAIEEDFNDFLVAVLFSESLTEKHRHFGNIPYGLYKERHASLSISYSLYVKKYEIIRRMMTSVSGKEYQKKILNEHVPLFDRDRIYNEMVNRFFAPKTRLRISAGILYMNIFNSVPAEEYDGSYGLLRSKAKESYKYLFNNFGKTILNLPEIAVDNTRNKMFDIWFPIQKEVANAMGHAILSTRGEEYFITDTQVLNMELVMLPGDIMLQRRNWHLSNIGIPGFWTHSAIYTGSITKMDEYFASEFPFEEKESMSAYLKDNFPIVYNQYQSQDGEKGEYSVIESIEPGVVLHALKKSADADFVVVLRPQLSKKDKMSALLEAFGHFGKPYDYNFDFDTRDALVCTELVYDSYFDRLPDQEGLHFDTSTVNGRKIVSPLNIAEKFKDEYDTDNAEFEFVYFLEGSEEKQSAFVSTEKRFLESVTWNKFSFLQESF